MLISYKIREESRKRKKEPKKIIFDIEKLIIIYIPDIKFHSYGDYK